MRRILFLVLMLSSVGTWAEDYYWYFTSTFAGLEVNRFDSMLSAKSFLESVLGDKYYVEIYNPSERSASLRQFRKSDDGYVGHKSISRGGDSCPEGTEYNPETGECESDEEPDECEAKAGQEVPLSKSGKSPDAFITWRSSDGMFFVTETVGCNAQCKVDLLDTRCKGNTSGDYWCWMTGRYTGDKCGPGGGEGGGGGPDLSHPDSEWVEPTKTEDTKPCIYVVNADGSKSCTSENTVESEGHSCGVANGVVVCSPPSKPPTKEDLKVTTTITEKTNPDGSTTTTKTDQADYVTCVGKGCTSSTTTSTTTTTTDGNGNTTGSSSTCTGPLCGDKNAAPGADGEGLGDCIINCGDGEGEDGGFDGGEFGEVKDFGESIDDFMDRAADAPIMQALSSVSFPTGGSCSFGAASTPIGTITLDDMCTNSHWLDPLYPIFLAAWCFAAIRQFMEA